MEQNRPFAEERFRVEFNDVDSMNVAWHGNYPRFIELGRRALLDEIGYGYAAMLESGYAWPIVDMRIKYVRPLLLGESLIVRAELVEWENRIRMSFAIVGEGESLPRTKAESVQMAVRISTGESLFVCPACLAEKIDSWLSTKGEAR